MNLFEGRLVDTWRNPIVHANQCRAQEEYCKQIGEHNYEIKSETIGDYGVINGTQTNHWYECTHCGHVSDKPVSYSDDCADN